MSFCKVYDPLGIFDQIDMCDPTATTTTTKINNGKYGVRGGKIVKYCGSRYFERTSHVTEIAENVLIDLVKKCIARRGTFRRKHNLCFDYEDALYV